MLPNLRLPLAAAFASLLFAASPVLAQRPSAEAVKQLKANPKDMLEVFSSYLSMVGQMKGAVADPLATLIIVQHDMKEIFEKTATPADAEKAFRSLLEGLQDPAARAVLRFGLVDVYKSSGQVDKALAELKAIAEESKARIAASAAAASGAAK